MNLCQPARSFLKHFIACVSRLPATLTQDVCDVCKRDDNDESMLLCDNCDAGYHMQCLTPPLYVVPPGEWFCPHCGPAEVSMTTIFRCSIKHPAPLHRNANACLGAHAFHSHSPRGNRHSSNTRARTHTHTHARARAHQWTCPLIFPFTAPRDTR